MSPWSPDFPHPGACAQGRGHPAVRDLHLGAFVLGLNVFRLDRGRVFCRQQFQMADTGTMRGRASLTRSKAHEKALPDTEEIRVPALRIFQSIAKAPRGLSEPRGISRSAGAPRPLCPDCQPIARQSTPVKFLSRINLAPRRNAAMAKHALWPDRPALQNAPKKRRERRHLRLGNRRVAMAMAVIRKLDPDRARIHVGYTAPGRDPCMPGALILCHHCEYRAIDIEQIMRADLGTWITKPLGRGCRAFHAGIMQDDHIGTRATTPRSEIRRWLLDETKGRVLHGAGSFMILPDEIPAACCTSGRLRGPMARLHI